VGFEESNVPALEVSDEEREQIYQAAWDKGNGLRFMFWTFKDLVTNEDTNKTACDFIRKRIDRIVKDPKKAEKLKSTELYARRPLCNSGYYEAFNRENVEILLKETPFLEFTPTAIKTVDGVNHELDVVICATGFDDVDGSYYRLGIRGRGGKKLEAHWEKEPRTYLSSVMADFPNLFNVNGPKTAFANIPPTLESHVEFITDIIAHAAAQRKSGSGKPVELKLREKLRMNGRSCVTRSSA
jgi:cation diffusion facilitator CzcD-associated flavoprotein CzcO